MSTHLIFPPFHVLSSTLHLYCPGTSALFWSFLCHVIAPVLMILMLKIMLLISYSPLLFRTLHCYMYIGTARYTLYCPGTALVFSIALVFMVALLSHVLMLLMLMIMLLINFIFSHFDVFYWSLLQNMRQCTDFCFKLSGKYMHCNNVLVLVPLLKIRYFVFCISRIWDVEKLLSLPQKKLYFVGCCQIVQKFLICTLFLINGFFCESSYS